MKKLLCTALLLLLPAVAQAEPVRQPGFSPANNSYATQAGRSSGPRVRETGNRIHTKEEMKIRNANKTASFKSAGKPEARKNPDGTISLKQKFNGKIGNKTVNQLWSNLND